MAADWDTVGWPGMCGSFGGDAILVVVACVALFWFEGPGMVVLATGVRATSMSARENAARGPTA
jgi:hypothetical protein